MNPHKQWPKEKSWQWRIIIVGSLLLIFGKDIGAKISQYLRFPEFSVTAATRLEPVHPLESTSAIPKMTIEVTNDSNKDFTISDKIVSGILNFENKQFLVGEVKRFVITAKDGTKNAHGDIVFTSSVINENKEVPCQIIHVLNYDLNYVSQIPQPLKINLSSIASRLECAKKASTP